MCAETILMNFYARKFSVWLPLACEKTDEKKHKTKYCSLSNENANHAEQKPPSFSAHC